MSGPDSPSSRPDEPWQPAGAHGVTAEVLSGDATERLLEYARERAIDFIALGRRGVGQIRGLLMGSVSWKINSLAECPVLTVRYVER
jgi:nucleotide-binding universal stress UspA family protein